MLFDLALLIVLALIFIVGPWALFCNYKTFIHRGKVIEDIHKEEVYKKFLSVSYDQHLFRLMAGRWNWRSWYYESK